MDVDHITMLWLSKSFGLFYLIGLSLIVVVYVYWPTNKKRFEKAAGSILEDREKPCL